MAILTTLVTAAVVAGGVYEEFNSYEELTQNWWISRWGHEPKQYDTSQVTVEDGVLKLTMTPDSLNGAPRPICGEITYTSQRFLYGSYRASIKTTDRSGGVVGWFVYNDGVPGDGNLHEVDMEILTEDLSQIHYTLHHDAYSVDHMIDPLGFDPSEAFHEYRFDWYPDSVVYFIDGIRREKLTVNIPDDSVSIMLNYWSNNNAYWGGDMPDTTTHMWVDYMHYVPLDTEPVTVKTSKSMKAVPPYDIQVNGAEITIVGTEPTQLSLFSLSGVQLFSGEISGKTTVQPELGRGLYILQVKNSIGTFSEKVLLK